MCRVWERRKIKLIIASNMIIIIFLNTYNAKTSKHEQIHWPLQAHLVNQISGLQHSFDSLIEFIIKACVLLFLASQYFLFWGCGRNGFIYLESRHQKQRAYCRANLKCHGLLTIFPLQNLILYLAFSKIVNYLYIINKTLFSFIFTSQCIWRRS